MSQEIQLVEGTLIDLDEGGAPATCTGEWWWGCYYSCDCEHIWTLFISGNGEQSVSQATTIAGGGGGGYSEGDEDSCTEKNHLLSASHMDSESIDRESEPLLARDTTSDVTLSVPGKYLYANDLLITL